MMSNKNKSVQVLTKGVEFLFKKNKVTYIKGKGVLSQKTTSLFTIIIKKIVTKQRI